MTQHCPRCDRDLQQDAYHPDKWGKPGHYCRSCAIEYKRQWRRARGIRPRPAKAPRLPKPRKVRISSTSYRAVHKQIQRARGKARSHNCAHCPAPAAEWAYDRTDPAPLTGATDRGVPVQYSVDPWRYMPLCKPCHGRFDVKVKP